MPLFWLSSTFLCGVFLGWLSGGVLPAWSGAAALIAFFLLSATYIFLRFGASRSRLRIWLSVFWPADREALLPGFVLPLLPLAVLLGGLRYQMSLPALTQAYVAWYNDRAEQAAVTGLVDADPEFRDTYTLLEVEADGLQPEGAPAPVRVRGRLLVRLPPGGDWQYGDQVLLAGRLRTPTDSEDFSYRTYLAHRGIYTTLSCSACLPCEADSKRNCFQILGRGQGNRLKSAIYALRGKALAAIDRLFPEPEAGLLAGILLGIETGISSDVLEAFRLTGTSHIIAISGFNFAIISGLLVWLFSYVLGRWRSLPAAWIGIGGYAILAGASAGVVRAAIMGSLSIFALRIGRRSSGLNTLAIVAAVMALFDPHVLWDVSFQLSFMATLGLMLYAEPLANGFTRLAGRWLAPQSAARLSGPVGEYFLFTLAAQVTTLPLILYYFHQVSLVSLAANPLVLPVQPPLMVMGGLAAVSGIFVRPLGQLSAVLAWPWIAYTIRVVELLAGVGGAALTVGQVSVWLVAGFYALLFAATLWGARLRDLAGRISGARAARLGWALILGLALLTIVCWQRVFALPDGLLRLTVLDVGTGDALLVQTPDGRSLLVDGGSSPNGLSDAIGRRLPFGQREIDYLVVAAAGEEQLAALPRALDRFGVNNVLWAGPTAGSYSARELRKRMMRDQTPLVQAQPGQILALGSGARLEVLAVTPRGAILLLEWGRFRALLPVGLDFDAMEALMHDRRLGPVTALLLADGGHTSLNTAEWIRRWQPQVALLSVASGDPDGLPHPETLAALQGTSLLRTDWHGWIELSTDSEQMWVVVERR